MSGRSLGSSSGTHAEVVQIIGRTIVLYRKPRAPQNRAAAMKIGLLGGTLIRSIPVIWRSPRRL
ncbi:MAG: hypothetical protein ACLSA6_16300 [Holdemania massiliensis]